jgi:ketosteroid isomerase-like protein
MLKINKNMRILTLFGLCLFTIVSHAQQLPDTSYVFKMRQAAFAQGQGPTIFIDEGHNNFHVPANAFDGFVRLVEHDGFQVKKVGMPFDDPTALVACDILVIVNALHSSNTNGNWVLPNPSAFTKKEIKTIHNWVKAGGKLLLIADHMPFGGAAYDLGKAFGFEWLNGFAQIKNYFWPPSHFEGAMLPLSPVSLGMREEEQVKRVASFTGSAFKAPEAATPVLQFLPEHGSLQPDTAWRFNENTPIQSLKGYCQGALLNYHRGKVAAWGEAGMLAAQVIRGHMKAGYNSPYAPENEQMVLNLMHWLADVRGYAGEIFPKKEKEQTALEREILAVNRQMEAALEADDMLRLAYFYDDEGVLISGRQEVSGREAIDDYWFRFKGKGRSWKLENVAIGGDGNTAWQRGISHLTYIDREGKEVLSVVRFTLVWRKNEAGNWKIMVDHYSGM